MQDASLAFRVNRIIVLSLVLGIGGLTAYFGFSLISTRDEMTKSNIAQQGAILSRAIENFMLSGNAPDAVRFFKSIESTEGGNRVELYRTDGVRAFSDPSTILAVNALIGRRFDPAAERITGSGKGLDPDRLKEALDPARFIAVFPAEEGGMSFIHTYRPLSNKPQCSRCHGTDHAVRGIIDLKTDVSVSMAAQSLTLVLSPSLFAALVGTLAAVLTRFMKKAVVGPVSDIGALCERVASGDFSGSLKIAREDEVGRLALTVNGMVKGLRERSELTKYVSGSTIRALDGEQRGERAHRTMFFSDIRGFTSYSERHGPERVVANLNRMLELQAEAIAARGGDVDKFVGDAVVAIFSGPDAAFDASMSALDILAALAKAGPELDGLSVGIGIASGEVIQGMIGSAKRADFTVIGDAVNVASRLCSAAKAGQAIVSAACRAELKGRLPLEGPYKVKLKGKEEAQIVYFLKGAQTS